MKDIPFYITYFYNVRYLPASIVPVSTALSDPKWFKGEPREDKRGVIIGLNFSELSHPLGYACGCPCSGEKKPEECRFLKTYLSHLRRLNWNLLEMKFTELKSYLESEGKKVSGYCLLVHEKPDTKCSERWSLITAFKEHGVDIKEWTKEEEDH